MELSIDIEKFEELQEIFVREIIEQVRFKLVEAGLEGEKLLDTTASIAFSVTSTIDDTANIKHEGVAVRPYLTFQAEEGQLIHCGENSYSHEYVTSVMDKIFGK